MRTARLIGLAILTFALAPVAPVAAAQVPTDTVPPPHRLALDASALRPTSFTYQVTLTHDTTTTQLGERVVSLGPATYAGSPALQLVETRTGNPVPAADTLVVGPTDLHPLHWSAALGPAHLAAEFSGDTVFGGTTGPPGRRSFTTSAPGGLVASAAMFETALRLLPLHAGWRDSTTVLSVTLGSTSAVSLQLGVVGDERVRVPAGIFDCWVVMATADSAQVRYWVTKQDPMVVKTEQPLPGGAQLTSVLSRAIK